MPARAETRTFFLSPRVHSYLLFARPSSSLCPRARDLARWLKVTDFLLLLSPVSTFMCRFVHFLVSVGQLSIEDAVNKRKAVNSKGVTIKLTSVADKSKSANLECLIRVSRRPLIPVMSVIHPLF